ncbi:hypothetical protein LshimejAT787_1301850 [Lyophyllum shimeji]|uniref:Fungal-type protein kinase domain-containing protein n=1 Tax=Lyophyllum shimeji TaxID=47721 RepID=A0A9P3UPX8_LYOSH|nr:hypothetical protein LshimejAT787_1301850 [Lyophyllum shimeji]
MSSSQTSYTSLFELDCSSMSIVSSTPSKRVTGLTNHVSKQVTPILQKDPMDKYSWDVSTVDFATHVWGIDSKVGRHILQQEWELSSEPLAAYLLASTEAKMYRPFAEIADSLVKAAGEVVRHFQTSDIQQAQPVAQTSNSFSHGSGTKVLKSPYALRKPNMLAINKDVFKLTPVWSLVRQIIELKNKSPEGPDPCTTASSDGSSFPLPVSAAAVSSARRASVRLLRVSSKARSTSRNRAMKLYSKLWEVGSVETFQQVFVDCVECHYHAYIEGRVLHRDLSENNLMFQQGEGDTVKGILNDWDMASYVENNNEIKLSTRTGTVPFMARDLLTDGDPPPHLYRHDLESFYYILVWAALHYDFERKERHGTIQEVKNWNAERYLTARAAKISFITHDDMRDTIFSCVRPDCQALLPWLNSVGDLFDDGYMAWKKERKSPGWDNDTLGGHITFENFMAALGRTPR